MITPSDRGAICENVAGARSITRLVSASRSSTTHVVDAPLASLVTVSRVPNARYGLAHVPALALYQVAWPTTWWVVCSTGTAGAGGGGAIVVGGAVSVVGVEASVVGGAASVVVGAGSVVAGGAGSVVVGAVGAVVDVADSVAAVSAHEGDEPAAPP